MTGIRVQAAGAVVRAEEQSDLRGSDRALLCGNRSRAREVVDLLFANAS